MKDEGNPDLRDENHQLLAIFTTISKKAKSSPS